MSARFADSNVVIYLATQDRTKIAVAERLIEDGLSISVQVLNEVANVFVRKLRRPWSEADLMLSRLRASCEVVPLTETTHELGISIAKRHRINIYDSMIVAAALLADCDTLYSEHMHPGLVIDGRLTIVNPFAG